MSEATLRYDARGAIQQVPGAMSPSQIERLRQLFGAYFHQDWALDAPDPDGIIDCFIADHPNKIELSYLAELVDAYAGSHSDDGELERSLITELWCQFLPTSTGVLAHDWLAHVSSRLRAASQA